MAPLAAVSWEYMRARLKRGSAIVMMMRIIAITISNSIREKPRRRRCRFIIRILTYFMTSHTPGAWRGIGAVILKERLRDFHDVFLAYRHDCPCRSDCLSADVARHGGW